MEPVLTLCLAAGLALQLNPVQQRNICRYEEDIVQNANKYALAPELVAGLMFVESAYYPNAVSHADACGLMQVVPKWTGGPATGGKEYTCEQLKDPRINIRVGTKILNWTINIFAKGNLDQGLCFYNAGTICRKKVFYKNLYYVKLVKKIRDRIKRVHERQP
jgi:soluble lytic murein transglycosylase-like protein